jgi:hypothetical protein
MVTGGCGLFSDHRNQQKLNLKRKFAFEGLKNRKIFKLQVRDGKLFAGTSEGLVSFTLSSLKRVGTFKKRYSVHTFLIFGRYNWLISAVIRGPKAPSKIYKSTDQGKTWFDYTNGYGGSQKLEVYSMDALPKSPSVIFACPASFINVAKSTDGGKSWKSVATSWNDPPIGSSNFVKIDPYHPNNIWLGGSTGLFYSSLLKSRDGGDTWKRMVGLYMSGNIVYSLGISSTNSNHLLAGLNGGIEKSIDGGKTWHPVLKKSAIFAFTHSARNPKIIYASGLNAPSDKTGTLFFEVSSDFGNTWKNIEMPDSPTGIYVNDMVSVMQNGNEVLYFGTNKGIYSYTFEK